MLKRTTILLDESVYRMLVEESLKRYGTTKTISKVANELLKEAFRGEAKILKLIRLEKVAETSTKEFEEFRRQISRRLES